LLDIIGGDPDGEIAKKYGKAHSVDSSTPLVGLAALQGGIPFCLLDSIRVSNRLQMVDLGLVWGDLPGVPAETHMRWIARQNPLLNSQKVLVQPGVPTYVPSGRWKNGASRPNIVEATSTASPASPEEYQE
jgi:hypothetical protein